MSDAAPPAPAKAAETTAAPGPKLAGVVNGKTPARHAVAHRAELAHHTAGRVRLKIPGAKDNPALLNTIRASFEGRPGVDAIHVKPATGSLVIFYDDDHHENVASLFAALHHDGAPAALPHPNGAAPAQHRPKTKIDEVTDSIAEEAEFLAEHSHLARSIVDSVKQLDRQIKRSTNNTIDLKILAPVGLAAFTFLEIGAAAATPMWVTLVIFSLNHFVELRAHDAADPEPDQRP